MTRYVPPLAIVLAIALTAVSGAIHGVTSNRWGPPQTLVRAADKLTGIPENAGPWQLRSQETISKRVLQMLECAGYHNAYYQNQETGESVQVAVLLGPSGPIAVHTPDICYPSRSYEQLGEPTAEQITDRNGGQHTLWATTMKSTRVTGELLRVYYGWTTGGPWQADEDPRFEYATKPYLYKIQLAGSPAADADLEQDDLCRRFLEDFLPALAPHLIEPEN